MVERNGQVLVHRSMSLDGRIAGPEHAMDWIFTHPVSDAAMAVGQATGAIVAGRHAYDVGPRDTGKPSRKPYGGAWSGAHFVATHHPPAEPVEGTTFVAGDIAEIVATARDAAEGGNVELFGTDLAAQAFAAGLVDTVLVHVLPVLLGDGVPLHAARDGRVDLELVSSSSADGVTHLEYRVRR
jgi:dihydrofolate reductase